MGSGAARPVLAQRPVLRGRLCNLTVWKSFGVGNRDINYIFLTRLLQDSELLMEKLGTVPR